MQVFASLQMMCILLQDAVEVQFINDLADQKRILQACHVDPTSGHMGVKRTVRRIGERFHWHGLYKDVEEMVR